MGCGASQPAAEQPAAQRSPARDTHEAQIMISYRVAETGAESLGGDGSALRIKLYLESLGYSVFMDRGTAAVDRQLQQWAERPEQRIIGCQVFIALCSPGYGGSTWTVLEYQLAHSVEKTIIPVWHSGQYPPAELQIYMTELQRVPSGSQPLVEMDFKTVMQELTIMISYRVAETGAESLGGDGMALRIKLYLVSLGYSVFLAEVKLWGGQAKRALIGCQLVIALCSPG
ncbi:hypothetical protein TSOC_011735 [Tetrabaena socialis]|uniref:TIR domain-containing protein n=1 Tax=Tetrabaena socialis TaxID=47790 RepID=A0A2J7ZPW9_9CHLO|nr:hypothetical protein TSOC_011735 [Tetrabaena socialis]|eukprot:PNH02306.1 hypothetical protein TSOC_011735 [Tetrabaena socialis]